MSFPVELNKPLFDAEGVAFDVHVSVAGSNRPHRARCNVSFGYTSWYADCAWIKDTLGGGQNLDLDVVGVNEVTKVEATALALWATKP